MAVLINRTEQALLIAYQSPMTMHECAEKLQMNYHTVQKHSKTLKMKNLISGNGVYHDKSECLVATGENAESDMLFLMGLDGIEVPLSNYLNYWLIEPAEMRTTKSLSAMIEFYEIVAQLFERLYNIGRDPEFSAAPVETYTLRRRLEAAKNQIDSTSSMIGQVLNNKTLWIESSTNPDDLKIVSDPMFPSKDKIVKALQAITERQVNLRRLHAQKLRGQNASEEEPDE